MKYLAILLIILTFHVSSFSQTPTHTAPTLQVGLDGLSFGKGVLDSELILQIISEKQDEIKLRVAQNILLSSLNDGGGTIYAYGDNILRAIIEEKDPILRKRKILESLVNTLFSISFKEYYEQKLKTIPNSLEYKAYIDLINLISSNESNDIINNGELNIKSYNINKESIRNQSQIVDKPLNETNEFILFNSIILDIATEAIRKNRQFDELGIFNVSYSKTYEYQSHFLNPDFEVKESFNSQFADLEVNLIKEKTNILYESMKKELHQLGQLIGFFNLIIERSSYRYNESNLEGTMNSFSNRTPTYPNFGESLKAIENILSNTNLNNKQFKTLSSLKLYIEKASILTAEITSTNQTGNLSDIIYTIEKEFIPEILDLGLNNSNSLIIIENLRSSTSDIARYISRSIDIQNLFNNENLSLFVKLLSKMYEFDRSNTYIDYTNYSFKIADTFTKSNSAGSDLTESIDYFNTFVKDYIIFTKDEDGNDFIDFKVEGFLAKLSDMKKLQPSRLRAVFDVGASAGSFYNTFTVDGNQLSNLSFVGEKIGVKYNFIDRKFWQSKSPGEIYTYYGKQYLKTTPPNEPIISNYYFLFYGTGILYNLFNTSTEKSFNSPFLGTGIGIGFFNNLDLSFTTAIPLASNLKFHDSIKYALFSINFDIRFNEYFQRLNEKRKAAQTQKALAKAGQ